MPNVNDLKNSKFLTKEDVEPPVLVTIKRYEEQNVELENNPKRMKWTLFFHELEKPMVLNMTNGMLLKQITGTDDFDGWIGKKIVLYNDETVMFAGEFVGGIRIRASARESKPKPEDEQRPVQDEEPICPDCKLPCANGCKCIPF